jgi:hypothetical protein
MTKTLHETNDLTAAIKALHARSAQPVTSEQPSTGAEAPPTATHKSTEIIDELTAHKIPEDIIKKLLTFGEPFKKALRILGFKKSDPKAENNPILAFIKQNYVQEKLIKTGLLNANTFKAIYNAVAKNLIADSEFFKVNDYNIVYCCALYKKPVTEIEKYFLAQSKLLEATAATYSSDLIELSRKTFLAASDSDKIPTVQSATELNSLSTVEQLLKQYTGSKSASDKNDAAQTDSAMLDEIVSKLDSLASKYAVLVTLSTTTKSKEARNILNNAKFSTLNPADITGALMKLSDGKVLPKDPLSEEDADSLAKKVHNIL